MTISKGSNRHKNQIIVLFQPPASAKYPVMNSVAMQRIAALRPLLRDENEDVRLAAAGAIERLEGLSGFEEVITALKTGDSGARIRAIYALGAIGGEKVVAPLVYCSRRPEDDIRAAAVEVLGNLALPATMPVLLERLSDVSDAVQARAIAALARFPASAGLIGHLRHFLDKSDGSLEAEAAIALARLGDLAVAGRIADLLASPHASTRQAAATALGLLPLQ